MYSGEIIEGILDAISEEEVINSLKNNNYMPIKIEEMNKGILSKAISIKRLNKKDLAIFCRQFSTMINAGVSIVKAFEVLENQIQNKIVKKAIQDISKDIQKGMPLSKSIANKSGVFPSLLANMVEAGEVSGNLYSIMNSMSNHYEKEYNIENKVRNAALYPLVLMIVSIAVVLFLIITVIPIFTSIFDTNEIELPFPTKLLISISIFLRDRWKVCLISVLLLILAIQLYKRTDKGKLVFDTLAIKTPILGRLHIRIIVSRFARTLAILLSSGISLINSMDITIKIIENQNISCKLKKAKENIRAGVSLSQAIKEMGTFPDMIVSMIAIGEESGALDEMLNKTADFYDSEIEIMLERIVEMIQPALIILMTLIIGFIIMAITMPMFELINII